MRKTLVVINLLLAWSLLTGCSQKDLDTISRGLNNISDDLNRNNSGYYISAPYSSMSLPSTTWGSQAQESKHFLINTPSGLKRCTVTPSGYTFCN